MSLTVTAIYAGAAGLLLVLLALRIPPLRYRLRQGLGDGGHAALERAVRIHGNATEHIPIALILLGLCEIQGGPAWLLHLIGGALLAGRLLHALGLARSDGASLPRLIGMVLTFSAQIAGAVGCLALAL